MTCDNRCIGDDEWPAPCTTCRGNEPTQGATDIISDKQASAQGYRCLECKQPLDNGRDGYFCPTCLVTLAIEL